MSMSNVGKRQRLRNVENSFYTHRIDRQILLQCILKNGIYSASTQEEFVIIFFIIGRTALRIFCHICLSNHPVLTYLDFVAIISLQSKYRQPCVQSLTSRTRSLYLCPRSQGDPVISVGTKFLFRPLLQLTGLWWRFSIPPRGIK
jgi:hypothetical protein